ncbi:hypothetical protein DYB37_010142 [Aphanomyces astaci]|uniref:Uncharacterized protein n=1 Tax=Aphanomyces astaci TaxID=112090 RepID=A0A397F0C9_APHAT|nr:hypothetical protein DYB38_002860 [Aphanomyces astaci]RHY63100.1 hypothetical protein DYB34_007366 [Aphanomyces astaci]RHZ03956.1 hypothetical protein DYB37_010142 [Aphanomyces astaci]RHZ09337.1 hypothetical protein DYB31_005668 [Aphanomyces astaci]RLO05752.1 hypothetical protein DYB28_009811 [Aphanomyces astaci]
MGGAVWQKYMKMGRQMAMPDRVNAYWNGLTVTERQSVLFLDEADLVKQLYKLNFSLLCVGLMQRRLKKASSSSDEPTYELLEAMEFMDIGTGIMTVKNELVQDGHAPALFELIQASLHGFLAQPHVLSDKDFTQLFFHDSEGVSSWDEYQHLIAMLLEQRESLRQMEALLQEVDEETKHVASSTTKKKKKRRKLACSTTSAPLNEPPSDPQPTTTCPSPPQSPPASAKHPLPIMPPLSPPSDASPRIKATTARLPIRMLNPAAAEFKPLLPLKRKFESFVVHVENDEDAERSREYHGWRRGADDDDSDSDEHAVIDVSRDVELDAQLAHLYHVTSELFGWNFSKHCEYRGYEGPAAWNDDGFFLTNPVKSNLFVKVGMPFVLFVVGGFTVLNQFLDGKMEKKDVMVKSQSERAFNLDEEHRKIMQKLNTTDLVIKRIPAPGEDPRNVK